MLYMRTYSPWMDTNGMQMPYILSPNCTKIKVCALCRFRHSGPMVRVRHNDRYRLLLGKEGDNRQSAICTLNSSSLNTLDHSLGPTQQMLSMSWQLLEFCSLFWWGYITFKSWSAWHPFMLNTQTHATLVLIQLTGMTCHCIQVGPSVHVWLSHFLSTKCVLFIQSAIDLNEGYTHAVYSKRKIS